MKLILLQKVLNLGDLGDTVDVKSGYGRNYLVPQGKAVPATKENVAMYESRKAELQAAADERLTRAEKRKEAMVELVLELTANATDEGHLFGSIGPREIEIAAAKEGVELEKSEVVMGEGPIRETGEYDVLVQLHADVDTEIRVIVRPEE